MARPVLQPFPMLGPSRAQTWTYSPRYRRPRHFHAEPELNVVVAGTARFGIGNLVRDVRAGEMLAFPPAQDHVLLAGSPDLELFALGSSPALVREATAEREPTRAFFHVRLEPGTAARMRARCGDASGLPGTEQVAGELWLLALWAAKESTEKLTAPHVLTRRALALCHEHPEASRAELARALRTDPTDVSRHFHRDLGVTLSTYRQRLRVLAALAAVDRGASITAAALDAGFGSYSQCHRVFQDVVGTSPSAFVSSGARAEQAAAFEPCEAPVAREEPLL
jgi:AraC-like DNA-binding protein